MSPTSDAVVFSVILAVNLLLVGSLVVGSLAVTFRLLKNASPRARYVISLASFVVTVAVPVTLSVAGSPELMPDAVARHESLRSSDTQQDDVMPVREVSSGLTEVRATAPSATLGALAVSFSNSAAGHVFFLLWMTGGLYLTLREVVAHRRISAAVQNWEQAIDSERDALLCPEGVPLYFDEEERPATVGLLNPAVVLPASISSVLPPDSVRHILRHEVAHARWRDPLANSILRLLRSVFWVCPALWLIERCARAEMEAAADRAVVVEFSASGSEFEATALQYATTLLAAAQQFNSFGPHKYGRPQATSLGTGSSLETRVRRLLEYSAKPRRGRVASATVIAALSLAAMTAMPLASRPPEAESASHGTGVKTHTPPGPETAGQNFFDDTEDGVAGLTGRPGLEPAHTATGVPSRNQTSRLRALEADGRETIDAPKLQALDTRLRNMNALGARLNRLNQLQPLDVR